MALTPEQQAAAAGAAAIAADAPGQTAAGQWVNPFDLRWNTTGGANMNQVYQSSAFQSAVAGINPSYTPGSASTGSPDPNNDANAILQNELASWGLADLAPLAMGWITDGQGIDQIMFNIRQTPQYAQRFPGMALRKAAGLPAISEAQYTQYEDQSAQIMRAAGIPADFYSSRSEIGSLIGSDVSASELNERVQKGYVAATQAPQDVRDHLSAYYGIDTGHLAAYYLDPTKALPLLERQMQTAQIGAQATRTGYGDINLTTADQLAGLGVSDNAAQKGFTNLAHEAQLFTSLPGQESTAIDQTTQLGAEFGQNAQDQALINRRAEERVADFKGGGAFGATSTGLTGTGQAKEA